MTGPIVGGSSALSPRYGCRLQQMGARGIACLGQIVTAALDSPKKIEIYLCIFIASDCMCEGVRGLWPTGF